MKMYRINLILKAMEFLKCLFLLKLKCLVVIYFKNSLIDFSKFFFITLTNVIGKGFFSSIGKKCP